MTRDRDERGSLLVALAVVVVLSGLALAIMTRTVGALSAARVSQDEGVAGAAADAGVTDAVATLDSTGATSGSGNAGGAAFVWRVSESGVLTSMGTSNGRSRSVTATATRQPAYPWLVDGRTSLVLDGPNVVSGSGRLASGGPLILRNGSATGVGEELLGAGASCSGCALPVDLSDIPPPTSATVPTDPLPLPCPTDPTTGLVDDVTPGVYECSGSLAFAATATVDGPVVIYLTGGAGLATLDFGGAVVNGGGDPADLVIHVVGAGVVEPGDGTGAGQFTGVIDAPYATLRSDPCDFSLTGSLVIGSLACTSPAAGPGASLTYDSRVAALPGSTWTVSGRQDAA